MFPHQPPWAKSTSPSYHHNHHRNHAGVKMPINESEKCGTAAVTAVDNKITTEEQQPKPVTRTRCESNDRYLCGCRICVCGAAVEYPGDVCSICCKYH
ncbi:hypothetical protein VTI74DRAFT_10142 [Chaetomium olivicolor]